jgi:hypothetical protein
VQCSLFVTKETLEALAVQATPDLVGIAILAAAVQLPLAAVAAWSISWLRAYLAMGAEAIRVVLALRVAARVSPFLVRAYASPVRPPVLRDQRWYQRRGPPRFS